ncbi:GNAT family N-acetyltransferase [Flavobacterium sp. CYK-55]|uniref:GNAT family N-acetyltransferase n=1 Tax=Flavobacterium sp. CYK-55 TaxID=2835529 RepID=UPI001BCCDDDD|nr:GNAT family protein [Flavobacterium sp. CYK-55]MBS7787499.1 GNAT family N-acetyltransferase [Flavobacterium sp. CYK-55]
MVTLQGTSVYLRALEPEDLDFVYQIENDESIWEISSTQTPYSRFLIRQYLEQAQQDIYQAKQLRLAICKTATEDAIGLIDLFDFDPLHKRAGVGILIQKEEHHEQGFGSEALGLLINYAFTHLHLHQLYANISTDNQPSLALFAKFGFEKVGVKKQWIFARGTYHDEALFQLIQTT